MKAEKMGVTTDIREVPAWTRKTHPVQMEAPERLSLCAGHHSGREAPTATPVNSPHSEDPRRPLGMEGPFYSALLLEGGLLPSSKYWGWGEASHANQFPSLSPLILILFFGLVWFLFFFFFTY